jgi:hypothetical protein
MILFTIPEITADQFLSNAAAREKKRKKKGAFNQWISGHKRPVMLLIANFFFNHDWVFKAIGWLNRRHNFIFGVFVAYPATEAYARAYVYQRHRHIMRWLPWPSGFFRENGKWGLMMVISALEKDFYDSANEENLRILVERTEKIREMLGASQKTFAGILPGVLYAKGIIADAFEADVTVEAIQRAEAELRKAENYPDNTPLIILGGQGFIGSRMIKRLQSLGREVYSVEGLKEWPEQLNGKKAILINLTKKRAISKYIGLFWPELILLNEVYPEPSDKEVKALGEIGSPAYHVVGVVADSYPSFPKAYYGGIPCCAAWNSPDMEVIIRKLS